MLDEEDAIIQLKQGYIQGLEILVRLYQVKALQMAYLTTRDYALAEDVVQAAFIHAYENIHQFDTNRSFGPWFLRSVVNRALRTASREKPFSSLENDFEAGNLDLPVETEVFEALEAVGTREMVLTALDRLTPTQRAVIVLRYYLDLSDTEMVEYLKVPPGTIRRRLHDARQNLRHLLFSKEPTIPPPIFPNLEAEHRPISPRKSRLIVRNKE